MTVDAGPLDVIRKALEREKEARRMYVELARSASAPEVRELFLSLAEEERKHADLLGAEIERETLREM